ncbi:uncharacterized protein LOC110836849 isoform X1 [Zootermopsis nevadensis]|uniref:uncharacterized protein LOC110836849 isoform X1 n=1 Tax=Zootermopsis nevadensis TaxID=136037 RepID=UPI000B8EC63B|nr:uncharacterized protein LOC110836849 isoform X1 [Zootermopsis nevadensis]
MCIPLRGYLPACVRPGDTSQAGRLVQGHKQTLTYCVVFEDCPVISLLFVYYAVVVEFISVNQQLVIGSIYTVLHIKVGVCSSKVTAAKRFNRLFEKNRDIDFFGYQPL